MSYERCWPCALCGAETREVAEDVCCYEECSGNADEPCSLDERDDVMADLERIELAVRRVMAWLGEVGSGPHTAVWTANMRTVLDMLAKELRAQRRST